MKWLLILDEFTRQCVALKVGRRITSEDVIDTQAELSSLHGVPLHIRPDNGPEFVSHAIQQVDWSAPIFCTKGYESTGWLNSMSFAFSFRQCFAEGAHATEAENCRAKSAGVWYPSELWGR